MKEQQIIISGIGGQGVLFLTRVLTEAAMLKDLDVLTSETHGMAMRGGSVISHVKAGSFKSPLIRSGQADVGLFLHEGNLEVHRNFLKPDGMLFLNSATSGNGSINATELAKQAGSLVITNLALLGFALKSGALFCSAAEIEEVLRRISPAKKLEINLKGLRLGLEASMKS